MSSSKLLPKRGRNGCVTRKSRGAPLGFAVVDSSVEGPGRATDRLRSRPLLARPSLRDLFDLNAQATAWRDDFANGRVYEVTGKVPSVVFAHQEKPKLKPLPATPFNTDDVEGTGVTKTFRVSFDRNK